MGKKLIWVGDDDSQFKQYFLFENGVAFALDKGTVAEVKVDALKILVNENLDNAKDMIALDAVLKESFNVPVES